MHSSTTFASDQTRPRHPHWSTCGRGCRPCQLAGGPRRRTRPCPSPLCSVCALGLACSVLVPPMGDRARVVARGTEYGCLGARCRPVHSVWCSWACPGMTSDEGCLAWGSTTRCWRRPRSRQRPAVCGGVACRGVKKKRTLIGDQPHRDEARPLCVKKSFMS